MIPVERIQASAAYWYRWETPWINGYPGEDMPLAPPLGEFEPSDADRYRELTEVPDAHVSYLKQVKAQTKKPLMFVHIPHDLGGRADRHKRPTPDPLGRLADAQASFRNTGAAARQ